jgi:pimeloyl-ACP methyl ester carboxylesterase
MEASMHTQETPTGNTATVNGAELYVERRGKGTPVLLVPGIPGDAGQFSAVADLVADDNEVVTYDRRGYSRSARPEGWRSTSVAEQVEDAAALLEHLGSGPAVVYGSSNGAIFALELAITHPDQVRGLILHEPPLIGVLADPGPVGTAMNELLEPAFAAGGPDAALEAFLRFAFGDATIEGLRTLERERILANGEVAMTIELPATQGYVPDREAVARLGMPSEILVGADEQVPFFREVAEWLASALGTTVTTVPGAHGPQFDHPQELAAHIAGFATTVS